MSENDSIIPASKTLRLKEENFEDFYIRVFETLRQIQRLNYLGTW
jgi:hypothetical protein